MDSMLDAVTRMDVVNQGSEDCCVCSCTYSHCRAGLLLQISETYDWRLAIPNMEKRDSYYTRLKSRIETTKKIHNEKVSSYYQWPSV